MSKLMIPCAVTLAASLASAQTVTNLGIAEGSTAIETVTGDHAIFLANELAQGVDWSGDGQLNDQVLFVHDLSTGATTNLGLPVQSTGQQRCILGERLLLCSLHESAFGTAGVDLNGDGDLADQVAWVHDLATGATLNLGLAVPTSLAFALAGVAGEVAAFAVSEAANGNTDLNGDGDAFDTVLFTYRAGQPSAHNTQTAIDRTTDSRAIAVGTGHVAFLVPENVIGPVDLNGDGDMLDDVVHVFDFATSSVTNLRLAAREVRADGDFFVLVVDEAAQAATDFSSDGDAFDFVPQLYIGASGAVRNLGIPVTVPGASGRANLRITGPVVAWTVRESLIGAGLDLNGDGDTSDVVLVTHHARANATRNSGLAVDAADGGEQIAIAGDRVGVPVEEGDQGHSDLNGDGDSEYDYVPHVFDARTGFVRNFGYAMPPSDHPIVLSRTHVAFVTREGDQGGVDLNGNGSIGDSLVAFVPIVGGAVSLVRSPVWSATPLALARNHVAFSALETGGGGPGGDLNGDGDQIDRVWLSLDLATGVATSLGLAQAVGSDSPDVHGAPAGFMISVGELSQAATDLNGDGDTSDSVVHVVRF